MGDVGERSDRKAIPYTITAANDSTRRVPYPRFLRVGVFAPYAASFRSLTILEGFLRGLPPFPAPLV